MIRFIIQRLLLAIPVLLGVTFIIFTLTFVLPGDPARSAADRYATPEQVEAVRIRLGLDRPYHEQYLAYLGRLAHGDLGVSIESRKPVIEDMAKFLPATFELMLMAMLITVVVGIPLGVITGSGRRSKTNSLVRFLSVVGVGMPVFWTGLLLQLIFFGKLGWLPLDGRLSAGATPPPRLTGMYTIDALAAGQWATFFDALRHLILPALTLSFGLVASIARITHSSMLEVMRQDYIRTARAKGLSDRVVLYRHSLQNAFVPVLTTLGLQVGFLLAGSVLVENIFSWGGIGTYAWSGIFRLDIPVIMAVALSTAVIFVISNLVIDVLYTVVDPRIRHG
jgi:ABC-type dipeptide/oligopeptide/nickel transport system permease component